MRVVASGSTGNCVLYDNIMVDIGVPYSFVKPLVKTVSLVLLTHAHKDHINAHTLNRLRKERPTLRVGCGEWMLPYLDGTKNVDVMEAGKYYQYGNVSVSPVKLYHDVPNVGYRIFINDYRIFHATDTAHLQGIEAKDYDLYAIEHNYDEDTIHEVIAQKKARGEFAHEAGTLNSHLSEQQARDFIFKNKGEHSVVWRLHETTTCL